jgi:hypothetical protein
MTESKARCSSENRWPRAANGDEEEEAVMMHWPENAESLGGSRQRLANEL